MLLFCKSARSHWNSFDPQKIDLDAFPRGCYAYHRLGWGFRVAIHLSLGASGPGGAAMSSGNQITPPGRTQ
jgi:hypothetical protein